MEKETVAVSLDTNDKGEVTVKDDLAHVDIYTLGKDHYRFPAMSKSALEMVLPKGSNRRSGESLTLVNASTTILMIPMRIVSRIVVDGEVWWDSPV